MRSLKALALAGAFLLFWGGARAQDTKDKKDVKPDPRGREGTLKAGDVAPDFTVKDMAGKQSVRLSQLKGKPVVLFFGSCT